MKRWLALVACLALLGCGSTGTIDLVKSSVARQAAPVADASLAAGALDAFALDLLRASSQGGNLVISPASIAIALGMTRAGAEGETAAQMDAVLHDLASDDHPTWLNALDADLASRTGTFKDADGHDQPVTLRIANAPFAQEDLTFQPAFLDALAERFDAGVRLVDFKTATEAARQAINAWVADQTEQRIKELLAQGTLDSLTRLVLVNAIYLKAAWLTPFDPSATVPAPFTRPDGTVVQVPTMNRSIELPYAEGTGWQAVELPYVGGQLAMTIIVPDDLATFVRSTDATALSSIVTSLGANTAEVDLSLPTFKIETKTELSSVLSSLGMPLAFDPSAADFSGMTTQERLYIGAVVHQANIDVDEKGTEASSATAVVMEASAAPADHVTLKVDRPFLFAIRDVPTGAIVFLGEVTDPSQGS